MNSDFPIRKALAKIPGWDDAKCAELSGGLSNRTWLIESGKRKGVLKLDDAIRSEPFNTRREEAQVQESASRQGLAPGIIYVGDAMIFTEYVEGTVWNPAKLNDDENLDKLAAALKRLHALPLTGRTFNATAAARRYVEQTTILDDTVIKHCTDLIYSMRLPHNLCCCHNDLVVENLITTPDLRFLDWEYSCDNDPFFDLATLVEHHELTDEQAMRLLDAYFDGRGERWRANLKKQRRLYLALLCLWMGARPDIDPLELKRVTDRLLTSCF